MGFQPATAARAAANPPVPSAVATVITQTQQEIRAANSQADFLLIGSSDTFEVIEEVFQLPQTHVYCNSPLNV